MDFLLDENIPFSFVEKMKDLGFTVQHPFSCGLRGSSDKEVANYAKKNEVVLITKDIEFGSVMIYPHDSHYGVIILRLPYRYTKEKLWESLGKFLKVTSMEKIKSKITVITAAKIRVRELP